MEHLTLENARSWIKATALLIAENAAMLTELDSAIGDGDHGENDKGDGEQPYTHGFARGLHAGSQYRLARPRSTLARRGICGDGPAMTPHTKKLIGTVLMLIWLIIYALMVSALAVRILPNAAWYVSLIFYVVAGLFWIVPIGLALPWMYREPKR